MDSKNLSNYIKSLFDKLKLRLNSSQKIFLVTGFLGVLILLFAGNESKKEVTTDIKDTEDFSLSEYVDELEASLSEIICAVTGESDVKIMITAETSAEKVYAKEVIKKGDETGEEYVIVKNSSQSQNALILKEIEPEIKGVVVVTKRGREPIIKEQIIDAIIKVLGIKTSQVSVVPFSSN